MRPGKKDRLVSIQSNTPTKNDRGATVDSWGTTKKVWAEKVDLTITERIQAGKVEKSISATYKINYTTGITEGNRLVDGSDTLEIFGVSEVGRKKGLKLFVGTV